MKFVVGVGSVLVMALLGFDLAGVPAAQETTRPPIQEPKAEAEQLPPQFSGQGKRDPFRPFSLRSRATPRRRENLSPLERFELGQLKVVGVVWNIGEPRAMIEDSAGLGYIVKVGTPIGANEGKVKAIGRNEIVVEESYDDDRGAKKRRDVTMKLATE